MNTNEPEDSDKVKAKKESDARLRDRFVRWQAELRQMLGGHVALIVAFASGGLAFLGSILNDDYADFSGHASCLIFAAGFLFLVALLLALFISWNRLTDVRETLEIIKYRQNNTQEKPLDDIIKKLKDHTDMLGKRTWWLVNCQLLVFAVAALLFCGGVFGAFKHRLFPPHHSKCHHGQPLPKFCPNE
jgi:hypothetical protein